MVSFFLSNDPKKYAVFQLELHDTQPTEEKKVTIIYMKCNDKYLETSDTSIKVTIQNPFKKPRTILWFFEQ